MNKKKETQGVSAKAKVPGVKKTVAVKSKVKGANVKRAKTSGKEKTKVKPAPIVEAGYSLYSANSESSVSTDFDTCNEVLARLKERRKVTGKHLQHCIDRLASSDDSHRTDVSSKSNRLTVILPSAYDQESVQSDTNAPFNQRLSSSTPDPERAVYNVGKANVFRTIPERDSSGPIVKETVPITSNLHLMAGNFQNHNFPTCSQSMSVPFSHYVDVLSNHGNTNVLSTQEVINTSSSGFMPTANTYSETDIRGWTKRDSDIQTYQAYIPRESTGFAVKAKNSSNDSKNQSSSSSGAKEVSHLITRENIHQSINSSGTDYVVLPWPQGGAGSNVIPHGTPVFQLQNGLFQIRPSNAPGQNPIFTEGQQKENSIRKTPSPLPSDLGGSYLAADAFQIPERDKGPIVSKNIVRVPAVGMPAETISSISGTNSPHQTITPRSHITDSTVTPRTESTLQTDNVQNVSFAKSAESNKTEDRVNYPIEKVQVEQQKHETGSIAVQNQNGETLKQSNTQVIQNIGSNISNQSQGQIFLLQTSQNKGSNSSSYQLIPVSVLPGTNPAVPMATNPTSVSSVVSHGTKVQDEKEAFKQEEILGEATEVKIPNPWSKVKMDAGLKKLRYLLGELKECGKIGKDVEVTRLGKEIEKTIETIPTLSSSFNLPAEIDLCLQPLRNENCQLRRKLRLANQHLKEKEAVKEKAALDFNVLHLQASNNALQKQVKGEKETKVKLAMEVKDLHSQIQRMKIERSKLLAALSEKETDELKVKQECLTDTQKFRHEIEELQKQTEAIQEKHEALEQENHILQITLQQRDKEIETMRDVVCEVKVCVASLIQELEETRTGDKSFISNNSFSLQRLVKVLGEDSVASFSQSKKPNKSTIPYESHYSTRREPATHRLSKQALATHDKHINYPHTGRFDKEGENLEEFRVSNSDTEVELNMENHGYRSRRKKSPVARRGQSLSPPSKRVPLKEKQLGNVNTVGSKQRRRTPTRQSPGRQGRVSNYRSVLNRSSSPVNQRNTKVAFDFSKNRYRKDSEEYCHDNESNVQQSCNQSEASRYSVTDYFQKYPLNKPNINDPSGSRRNHYRSYSQPNYHDHYHDNHWSPTKTMEMQDLVSPEFKGKFKGQRDSPFSPQDNLYLGTCLDNSLSAINDDNISSVSAQTVSTATTINDTSFRKGIAALDANILKLQLALQKTKNMLS